jgi:PucR C-terminal helix-turn-helix domain/GGDEF-like domain
MERDAPVRDVEYLESLSAAVEKGVRYGIEVLAVGEERAGAVPPALIVQARCAARHRVPLETALRRFVAAEKRLANFVFEEAAGIDPCQLHAAMNAQGAAFERLLAIATEEYGREVRARPASHEARLVERARRLLAGELVDPSILEYDLTGHHLGLLAATADARPLLRRLAAELDCRSLLLTPSPEELWAWLGSARGPVDAAAVRAWLCSEGDPEQPIGIGEPKHGRSGWRLTHEQARAALWVADAKGVPVVEYTEAALLASIGRDPVLTASLQERYLLPLANGRGGGQMLRATLRSYFQAGRNSASAAAALGVSRQTVANRLQAVERCIGQPLERCADALQAALGLEELGRISVPRDSLP